jgi:cobalamin biosynthesis Mg chelatase CobN
VVDRDVLRERKKKEEAMGKKKGEEAAAALATDLMAAASTAAGAVAEAVEAVGVKMGGRATPPPAVSPSGAPSAARANVGAEEKHPEAANEREEMLEVLDQYREKLRKDRGAKEQNGGLLFYFVLYDAVVVLLICIGWLVLLTRGLVVPSSVFR